MGVKIYDKISKILSEYVIHIFRYVIHNSIRHILFYEGIFMAATCGAMVIIVQRRILFTAFYDLCKNYMEYIYVYYILYKYI